MADNIHIRKASEILAALFNDETQQKGELYSSIFKDWKYVVGPKLSAHSKISNIKNNIVIVEVEHPGWLQLLQVQEKNILSKLQNKNPSLKLRGLSFKIAGMQLKTERPHLSVEESPVKEVKEVKEEEKSEAKEIETSPIDTDFQNLLLQLKKSIEEKNR